MGNCQICGQYRKLSFEHVPNKAAFNSSTIIEYSFEDVLVNKADIKGKKVQGGAGKFTLCKQCNNDTGAWYGGEYTQWAKNCMDFLYGRSLRLDFSDEATVTLLRVYPLRFLKQVVTCFFSESPGLARESPELVKFVGDRYEQHLPDKWRFYMNFYYNTGKTIPLRRIPIAGIISVQTDGEVITSTGASVITEITHPPFQLVMADNYHKKAGDITLFSQYGYDDQVNITLRLGVMKGGSPLPHT